MESNALKRVDSCPVRGSPWAHTRSSRVLFGLPLADQQVSSYRTMISCTASCPIANLRDFGGGCCIVWGLWLGSWKGAGGYYGGYYGGTWKLNWCYSKQEMRERRTSVCRNLNQAVLVSLQKESLIYNVAGTGMRCTVFLSWWFVTEEGEEDSWLQS